MPITEATMDGVCKVINIFKKDINIINIEEQKKLHIITDCIFIMEKIIKYGDNWKKKGWKSNGELINCDEEIRNVFDAYKTGSSAGWLEMSLVTPSDSGYLKEAKKLALEGAQKTKKNKKKIENKIIRNNDKVLHIWTDGAASRNGMSQAQAGCGVWFGENDERNSSFRLQGAQTNNRAELMALVKALEIVEDDPSKVILNTDSEYALKCVTVWRKNWVKNGWRTSNNKEVLNKTLIERLIDLVDARGESRLEIKWVKGHSSSEGNNNADLLARNGAKMRC
eukprot:GHVL01028237.1.p1 GENE.GHVL01028237.1~~GHVL01028237.1.p1  ORF type:complete len:281 (+),score=67.53 GHVL01028237.1:98-940(+)